VNGLFINIVAKWTPASSIGVHLAALLAAHLWQLFLPFWPTFFPLPVGPFNWLASSSSSSSSGKQASQRQRVAKNRAKRANKVKRLLSSCYLSAGQSLAAGLILALWTSRKGQKSEQKRAEKRERSSGKLASHSSEIIINQWAPLWTRRSQGAAYNWAQLGPLVSPIGKLRATSNELAKCKVAMRSNWPNLRPIVDVWLPLWPASRSACLCGPLATSCASRLHEKRANVASLARACQREPNTVTSTNRRPVAGLLDFSWKARTLLTARCSLMIRWMSRF